MKYIESDKIKALDVAQPGLEAMVPWAVKDGSLAAILKRFYPLHHEAALDLGCGGGSTLEALAEHFSKLYGVDLSMYLSVRMAEKVAFNKVDLNFDRLPYPDEMLDVVTAFQVIEHLENPFFVAREINRVLRPGGLFIFSVPNPYQFVFKIKYLLTGNMPPWTKGNNHLLFFTKDVLAKTYLSQFELLETIYQRGTLPFIGRLRFIFGGKMVKKMHDSFLPRSEWFGRRVCYVLKKKSV